MIARHIAIACVGDDAWLSTEAIPDRLALSILAGCAFNLKSGRGNTPLE
jgi:hypothetical protein